MQQTSNIISNGPIDHQALKQIQPFILYGLCYGSNEAKKSLWSMLLGKLSNGPSQQIVLDWALESLLWQSQVSNAFRYKSMLY